MFFEFIELPPFAAIRDELFPDDADFAAFQQFLCQHPDAGDVIPGTGGCRKIRWMAKGKGKRGGSASDLFIAVGSRSGGVGGGVWQGRAR